MNNIMVLFKKQHHEKEEKMNFIKTHLKDCFILEPTVFTDQRGYFYESYNQEVFEKQTGLTVNFVQDNQSYSCKGVLRGLHAQAGAYAQAKLVRVLKGSVLDIAVDVRKDSETFGQHIAMELSEENKKQLFIPRGFLHGFVVLSETAEFFYKCDNLYHKASEWGVKYNDRNLDIDWKFSADELIISEKDEVLPSFKEAIANLEY